MTIKRGEIFDVREGLSLQGMIYHDRVLSLPRILDYLVQI